MRISTDKSSKRMWIWWGNEGSHLALELGRVPSWELGFNLEFGTEDITLGVYLFLLDFYVSLDSRSIWKWLNKHPNKHFKHKNPDGTTTSGSYWEERSVGLRFDFGNMVFSGDLWTDMNNQPRKRHFYWFLMDTIFGRAEHHKKVVEKGEVKIDMPEGIYDATYEKFISYWKRPRWFFTKSLLRINIDIPVGIPHEGKGENSWDMGMDATFGSTFPIKEDEGIYQIAKRFAMECLKERQKYGSLHSPDYAEWKLKQEMKLKQDETPDIVNAAHDETNQ